MDVSNINENNIDELLTNYCTSKRNMNVNNNGTNSQSTDNNCERMGMTSLISRNQQSDNNDFKVLEQKERRQNIQNNIIHKSKSSPAITDLTTMGIAVSSSTPRRTHWTGSSASFTNSESPCSTALLTRSRSEEDIQMTQQGVAQAIMDNSRWEMNENHDHEHNIKHYCTIRSKMCDGKRKNQQSNEIEKYCTLKLRGKEVLSDYLKSLDKEVFDSDRKILDYLSELDAYLDGIENNSSEDIMAEDENLYIQDLFNCFVEDNKSVEQNLLAAAASSTQAETSKHWLVDIPFNMNKFRISKKYCSLPKKMKLNYCVVNDSDENVQGDKSISDYNENVNSENLKRNSEFRRTITSIMREDKMPNHTFVTKRRKNIQDTPRRQLSWIRNSMRKTCPIPLPEQEEEPSTSNVIRNTFPSSTTTRRERNSFHGNNLFDTNPNGSINVATISSERKKDINMIISKNEIRLNNDFESFNVVQFTNTSENIIRPMRNSLLSTIISNDLNQQSTSTESSAVAVTAESNIMPSPASQQFAENNSTPNVPSVNNSNNNNYSFIDVDILNTLLSNSTEPGNASHTMENRPRQMGRRSEFRPRLVAINTTEQRLITSHNQRPNSAPARVALRQQRFMSSEPSSVGSSRNPSPVSLISSSASSSSVTSVIDNSESRRSNNNNITNPIQQRNSMDSNNNADDQDDIDNVYKKWPHVYSRSLACTCCTLGLFNISRFAMFSIHFGANFIVQFLIFSVLFGIPFLWLQLCLGAKIQGGPVRMWRISPICKGIGISLLIGQALMAIYSAVSLTWVLVYFRDSFVTKNDKYRWQESYELYRGPLNNHSVKLSDTIVDYFNGVVLQRLQLGPGGRNSVHGMGAVRFTLAFNLALIWTIIFIVLCKSVRSFGKIVIGLFVLPLFGLIALCCKFLTIINFDSLQNMFPATDWQDFFLNSRSWMCAAQETFLTWGLLGVSIYTLTCKSNGKYFNKREIRRDAILIVLFTLLGLLLAAILGNSCLQILNDKGYYYFSGSYENLASNVFLLPAEQPLPPPLASTPSKWLARYSTVLGESFKRPGINPSLQSGYQVLRLVTELFPSTIAVATQDVLTPFWSFLGFSTFFLFGIAQLCAMWLPLAGALGESPSSVLLSCVTGIFLGIPLATESGITIIHFLDKVLGGAWWLILLWIGHILAVFLVRGRPYTSDILVNDLHLTQTFSAFIAFAWNVLLPVGLMFLCILEYRVSNSEEFFHWRGSTNYWPLWVRQTAGFLQLSLLLLVPIISIIQIYRYLTKGPPDILERVELLYRPALTSDNTSNTNTQRRPQAPLPPNSTIISLDNRQTQDDAPPKYTPPPSYTTATGARIAKMLRNSIRRSVRRLMGEPSGNRRNRIIYNNTQMNSNDRPVSENPPPDYSSVLVDPNGSPDTRTTANMRNTIASIEMGPRILYNSETQGRRRSVNSESNSQSLTASDVAQFLRPSRNVSFNRASSLGGNVDQMVRSSLNRRHSRSVENLVLAAAPIGESSIIHLNRDEDNQYEENVSVI